MLHASEKIKRRITGAERVRLFLDYDGTLADFAPTPEHVTPDPEVIELLGELAEHPRIRLTVISGRRLGHVEELLPLPGVMLAGTYGIELRLPDGEGIDRVAYDEVRPVLEELKPRWKRLIADRGSGEQGRTTCGEQGRTKGFFLEDKNWALAIHARYAADDEAEEVLTAARRMANEAASSDLFRVLGGHKFLEIGPTLAHKGKTVAYLLDRYPWPGALPLYVGDDDKDEEAFGVIQAHDGIAIRVCEEPCETQADGRLASPQDTRRWLGALLVSLSE